MGERGDWKKPMRLYAPPNSERPRTVHQTEMNRTLGRSIEQKK